MAFGQLRRGSFENRLVVADTSRERRISSDAWRR